MVTWTVFSGAGISGEAPASLPRGFALRNDVLRVIHGAAAELVPEICDDAALRSLCESSRKLEVVIGRLWGTIGPDALGCLLALRLDLPNEAHLLSALHLARGGTHATVNFDVGIELAYDLVTDRATLPSDVPDCFSVALGKWRAMVPSGAGALRVVATRREFEAWVADGRPPGLLKLHGSLMPDQRSLADVIVIDVDELAQLTPGRRAAVDRLGDLPALLITGYSGADPDVYAPLLAAASRTRATWRCYSLDAASPVWQDCAVRGIEVVTGASDGIATSALRRLLGLADAPEWPDLAVRPNSYADRFDEWARGLRRTHEAAKFAEVWAWLAADLGDLDTADAILTRLVRRGTADASLLVRHAEVLYTRARGSDRDRADVIYRHVSNVVGVAQATRNHCTLRRADVARGRAVRGGGGVRSVRHVVLALAGPLRVLLRTRGGRSDTESAADAWRALQQTGARVLERAAAGAPRWTWPLITWISRRWTFFGRRAEILASNGNRRALVRQQRLLLEALADFLAGHEPDAGTERELSTLHDAYLNADDVAGAGNCSATLALVAAGRGDVAAAQALLATAREEYVTGRSELIAAGAAFADVIERLVRRRDPKVGT